MDDIGQTWAPHIRSALRIIVALLFIEHATAKLFGFPHTGSFDNLQLLSLFGVAGMIELVGGLFLLFGLFARIAAFILSGEMAVAYFLVHAPGGFFPLLNRGEPAILFCFVFLYLAAAGPGPWSLDAARGKVPTHA